MIWNNRTIIPAAGVPQVNLLEIDALVQTGFLGSEELIAQNPFSC